jgi:hypothetical protein
MCSTHCKVNPHVNTVSRVCGAIDGVGIGDWIYWPLIHAIGNYKQLQTTANHHNTRYAFSSLLSWPAVTWQRLLTMEILQLHALRSSLHSLPYTTQLNSQLEVEVTVRLTVSQSVSLGVGPHLGLMTRYTYITNWQLRSCFCGAPSLTRGRVWLLYMLLTLARAVLLGSETLGTRDRIFLSQI